MGIQKIHPSLMDPLSIQWEAGLAQSFGQLWDIRSISILTAYRRTRKIQPNDPTKHASQKRSHSHQRSFEHVITVSFRSAFDSFFDVSSSAFLISAATLGEATARLYTFTTFTWSSSGSSLLSPQNSTMEVPRRDSNKTLWPRVHAFELNKPGKWSRNVTVLWEVPLISCCNSVYHWYLPAVSILPHF